jgi:type IV secretion system protein VirB4
VARRPEALLGDKILLDDHIADDVVLTRGNGVLAMFSADGVFPDTADDTDIAAWFERLHNALKNIAAEDVELTVYQCRGEADPSGYEAGLHQAPFARELDAAYRNSLFRGFLYSNRLFLAVQVHAPTAAVQSIVGFLADTGTDPRAGINERKNRLTEICDLLQAQLSTFGLRRLGYVRRGRVIFDEIAEAIVFAMTGTWRRIGATTGRMGHAMFSEALRFRRKHLEIHGAGDPAYAAMFAFKEYPATTWPGMFHGLATAPYRCTLMQSYRFLSNAAGMGAVGRKQNKMLAAGDKALSQSEALTEAADELMSRRWVLGDHSLVLIAFADSPRAIAEVGNAAWRDLAACGLVATRMTHALQAAYLSMLPGGAFWRPRPGFVKSSNFVAFAPLYNWPAGQERGHWPGPPIAIFRTLAGTPYRFHWQVGDVGNTLVTGATGSGKTTLAAFLIAMTAGRARVVALDHKRGWDLLIHCMGGDYAVLGAGEPHFAPLKALDATPRNIEFLTDLIRGCIGGRARPGPDPGMTEEEGRRLALGLATIMELPHADRRLGELRAFFDNEPEGAGARLEKWCWGGELGWVIDAPVDTVRFGHLNGLDTTALLENARARGPALAYLYHRISLLLDGTPLLIPCDEGWRALIDPTFRGIIEKQLRTIRSRNGAVVFITQSPRDIVDSGIVNILVEQCPSQFHLANPRGTREDYVDGLKLTGGQFEALRGLQGGEGLFLLVQGEKSVVAQLPMRGLDSFIRVLSAREEDLPRVDRIATPAATFAELRDAAE